MPEFDLLMKNRVFLLSVNATTYLSSRSEYFFHQSPDDLRMLIQSHRKHYVAVEALQYSSQLVT